MDEDKPASVRLESLAHDLAELAVKHRLYLDDATIDWAMAVAEERGEPFHVYYRRIVWKFRSGNRGWIGEPFAEDVTWEDEYAHTVWSARRSLLTRAAEVASILKPSTPPNRV